MTETTATGATPTADKGLAEQFFGWLVKGGATATAAVPTADAAMAAAIKPLSDDIKALTAAVTKLVGVRTGDDSGKDEWGEDKDDKSDEAEARRAKAKAKAKETGDSGTGDVAALGVRLATVRGRAEIIAPGIKFPTFDAAGATADQIGEHICACQRAALTAGWSNAKTKDAIVPFAGEAPDFAKMGAPGLELAFMGASEIMRQSNNRSTVGAVTGAGRTADDGDGRFRQGTTASKIEEFNKAAAEGWAKHSAAPN